MKQFNLIKYAMHNFTTKEHVVKIQKCEPRMKGFVCVNRERVLPAINGRGEHLFYDANNQPYYAAINEDGFHYQPQPGHC